MQHKYDRYYTAGLILDKAIVFFSSGKVADSGKSLSDEGTSNQGLVTFGQ